MVNPVAWYAIAAQPPPVGVAVWVIWDGRQPFLAARVRHPETGRAAWLTHDQGRAVLLPTTAAPPDPRRPWAGWHTLSGTQPDYWRPQHPEQWRAGLPEPAFVQVADDRPARLVSIGDTLAETAAEDLAREMEADRSHARALAEGTSPPAGEHAVAEPQWWRDPHAVTYSAPGSISRHEAEGRLMRALATERWVRVERPADKTFAGILARISKTLPMPPGEGLADAEPLVERTEPNGRDWDDLLTALGWIAALGRGPARVVRLRAGVPPLSWRGIGERLRVSHEQARRMHADALDLITTEANGRSTPLGDAARAELADLRRRNRSARMGAQA